MSEGIAPQPGSITWRDLTVPDADKVALFYREVVGWNVEPQSMGSYNDYNAVTPHDGETVAGICHARGTNAKLPPQWLIYITVEDLEQSLNRCVECGGEVVDGPRPVGEGRFCVIRDPAGAVAALYQNRFTHE